MQTLILRAKHFRNCSFVGMPIDEACPIEQAAMEQFNTSNVSEAVDNIKVKNVRYFHKLYSSVHYDMDKLKAITATDENQVIREISLSENNDFQ